MLCCAFRIVLATALVLFASAERPTSADVQEKTNLEVDTILVNELIRGLAFLRASELLAVAGANNLWFFKTFPTYETALVALSSLQLQPTSLFVDKRGYLYVVGTTGATREGRFIVLNPATMAILKNITIQRPFSNPSVSVSDSGRVVVSDLASGSLSIFGKTDEKEQLTVQRTVRNPPLVVSLLCGPALQASWLAGPEGSEEGIVSSPFAGGTLEKIMLSAPGEICIPTVDVRPYLPKGALVTTVSHTVADSGTLLVAANAGIDQLIVVDRDEEFADSIETGLHLPNYQGVEPNIRGDVHVAADDMGQVIVVASPGVPRISVFRYGGKEIERVGSGSIAHTVDAAAISPDGAVVAVAGSKDGQGVITLLRNPLALQDGEVDYRRPFTNRWAQQALQAQDYDPGGVDGIIGRRTIAAIKEFQAANAIDANGQLNAETLKALAHEGFRYRLKDGAPP